MVDIETTGLSPDRNAIIQLTAVSFDPFTRQIDPEVFNQCLDIPPHRAWDESTRNWWLGMPDLLTNIYSQMRQPVDVIKDFQTWCGNHQDLVFWSKPLSFDYPFIQSYFKDYQMKMPFDFRTSRDLRSFIAGYRLGKSNFDERAVEFQGEKHNALHDVFHQIKTLFYALEQP